ncbi:hypothetical protein [Methanosarcina sp.]|jgi:putative hemolysin|uniref:hypothetical protein n=1 Tax=Methanosarcina sp. TaxID=2213 RepID=UPI002B7CAB03|nr:hypothetical protein [Methanosarcina sp.]HOW14656.1 hypothetical protein [Methanosarcina sp.]
MPLKGKVLAAELYCNHNTLCFEDVIVYDACRSPVITGLLLAQWNPANFEASVW